MKKKGYRGKAALFLIWGLIFSACSLPIGDLLSGELSMKVDVSGNINFQNPDADKTMVGIINVYNTGSAISTLYYSAHPDTGYREIPNSGVPAGTPDTPSQRNIEDVVEGDWYIALDTSGLQAQLAVVKAGKDTIVTFGMGGDSEGVAGPGHGFLYVYNATGKNIERIRIVPVQDDGAKAAGVDFTVYPALIEKGQTWRIKLPVGKYAAEAYWEGSYNGEPKFSDAKASVIFVIKEGETTEADFKYNPGYAANPGWDINGKTSGNGTSSSPALIEPESGGDIKGGQGAEEGTPDSKDPAASDKLKPGPTWDGKDSGGNASPGHVFPGTWIDSDGTIHYPGGSWLKPRPDWGPGWWERWDELNNKHWVFNPGDGKWYEVTGSGKDPLPAKPDLSGNNGQAGIESAPGSIPRGAIDLGDGGSWIWERPTGSGQWEYYDKAHNFHWYYDPVTGRWYNVSPWSDEETGDPNKRYKPILRWPPKVNNIPGSDGGPGFPDFPSTGANPNFPFPPVWPGSENWYHWSDGSWLWERPKGSGQWEYYKAADNKHYYYNPSTRKWYDVTLMSKLSPNKGVQYPMVTWPPGLNSSPPPVELPDGGKAPGLPPKNPDISPPGSPPTPPLPPGGGTSGNGNGNGGSGVGVDEDGNPSAGDQTIITGDDGSIKIENGVEEGANRYPSEDGYAGGNTHTGVLAIVNMYKDRRVSRIEIYNDKKLTNRVMGIQLYDKANPQSPKSRLLDFKQQVKVVLNSGSGDAGRGYYIKVWFGIADSGADTYYERYTSANTEEMAYVFNGITTQVSFKSLSEHSGLKVYNNSYFPSNTRYRQPGKVKVWNYITEGISGNTGNVVITAVYVTKPSGRQDLLYRDTSNFYGYAPAWNASSKGPDPIRTVPVGGRAVTYNAAYDSDNVSPGIYWVKVTKSNTTTEYGYTAGRYKRFIVPECVTTNLTFNGANIKSTQAAFE
jgi:hypothetical protein